ncbi:MAG: hypothetical protein ACRDTF_14210 [Pseudonocardiaceae bacterium]
MAVPDTADGPAGAQLARLRAWLADYPAWREVALSDIACWVELIYAFASTACRAMSRSYADSIVLTWANPYAAERGERFVRVLWVDVVHLTEMMKGYDREPSTARDQSSA